MDQTLSPHGTIVRPGTVQDLARVVDQAFHYRGDVTLQLRSGEQVQGYVFNREPDATPPYLHLYIQGQRDSRTILYRDIDTVSFTGEDTACGNDWEAWTKKKESERHTDAVRSEAAARARGHL